MRLALRAGIGELLGPEGGESCGNATAEDPVGEGVAGIAGGGLFKHRYPLSFARFSPSALARIDPTSLAKSDPPHQYVIVPGFACDSLVHVALVRPQVDDVKAPRTPAAWMISLTGSFASGQSLFVWVSLSEQKMGHFW
jgi:hypothetical protein